MAKQVGEYVFIGTIDGICFYRMNGMYYARSSNPLSRKRVLTDPAFAATRQYAAWMAEASPIASTLYRTLPKEKRIKPQFRALTGMAIQLLKAGLPAAEVHFLLQQEVALLRTGMELVAVQKVEKPKRKALTGKLLYRSTCSPALGSLVQFPVYMGEKEVLKTERLLTEAPV